MENERNINKAETTEFILESTADVTIQREQYDVMLRAVVNLGVIESMYRSLQSYDYDKILQLIFGGKEYINTTK